MKTPRPKIPDSVRLKLWVKSGGRCEFPGCNELVWQDGLTLKEDNFAHIAHIVGSSPRGPRGDIRRSAALGVDYNNLILVCLKHSKLVDGQHKGDYTEEMLRRYKADHESRVETQTSVAPDRGTTVVRFIAPIRERRVEVSIEESYQALVDRYPIDRRGLLFDFSERNILGTKSDWKRFARDVGDAARSGFRIGNDRKPREHLSVFALGPIPALVHFGNLIGTIPADLFQKHRGAENWRWKAEPKKRSASFVITRPKRARKANVVGLVLSISGRVMPDEYNRLLGRAPVYEIRATKPGRTSLRYRSQLEEFEIEYRALLTEIRDRHGSKCSIHLFPAIPAPIAVACGRALLPKSDPSLVVYDNDRGKGGFVQTLQVN